MLWKNRRRLTLHILSTMVNCSIKQRRKTMVYLHHGIIYNQLEDLIDSLVITDEHNEEQEDESYTE